MEFKVHWLDNDKFNELPYKKAQTALGLADKNSGDVYVRDTGNVALDTFSVYHEIEHLKGNDHGEHEDPDEKGVYYKDTGGWMQTLSPFANFIPGIGPGVSLGLGAGGTAMSNNASKKQASQQAQPAQGTMNQFNPQASATPASPSVSQAGGTQGGDASGGMGGTINKVRDYMARQKGNWAGGPQ